MSHLDYEVLSHCLTETRERMPLGPLEKSPGTAVALVIGHVIIEATDTVGIEYGYETAPEVRFVRAITAGSADLPAWSMGQYDCFRHLLTEAVSQIPNDTQWQHNKTGGLYRTNGIAIDDATGNPGVLYTPKDHPDIYFFRPVLSWLEVVQDNGEYASRFSFVDA